MILEHAISAGIVALLQCVPDAHLMGLGIDIEMNRPVNPDAVRFFLTDGERRWLESESTDTSSLTLLRLWTVKEAILKADPASTDKLLGDYALEDPSEWRGRAFRCEDKSLEFQYSSVRLDEGFFSIAMVFAAAGDERSARSVGW